MLDVLDGQNPNNENGTPLTQFVTQHRSIGSNHADITTLLGGDYRQQFNWTVMMLGGSFVIRFGRTGDLVIRQEKIYETPTT